MQNIINQTKKPKRKPPHRYSPDELIKCLVCGKRYARPASHTVQKHGLTAYEYKKMFKLETSKGLIPPSLKLHMSQLARDNAPVAIFQNLIQKGQHTRLTKNHTITYERTPETLAKLKFRMSRENPNRPTQKKGTTHTVHYPTACARPNCLNVFTRTEARLKKYKEQYCSVACGNQAKNLRRLQKIIKNNPLPPPKDAGQHENF